MWMRRLSDDAGQPCLAGLRDLNPGYFALVMATGIVSRAVYLDGLRFLAGVLLAVAAAAYVVLVAAYGWRFARYRREFLADATDPVRAFAFFTFVAGSNVLGAGLAASRLSGITAGLLVIAGLAWLLLGYGVPAALIARRGARPALAGANGTWFIWVVGTQSVAVAVTALPSSAALTALAVACWSVGVVLYLIIATLVLAALLLFSARPADITPPYWVFMGATAISVLAGAQILRLPADSLTAARPVIAGLSVVAWAFGTWLIPPLIAVGVWRHLVRRVPLEYEPGLWSIVFPVGMYGVASRTLGTAAHVSWLVTLGRGEAWVAFAAWIAVFAGMAGSLLGLRRRATARDREGGQ
jgi:tellurite resistance protein TehA-like permease